ncbi:CFI-box-CTERM domain-containing protein [Bacillus infantis]|uniref:CFI-box-CTERM domain-containing protein n=1 Tax=Bacillus infantis TaxID=324767 RepID=UPI00344E02C9
MGKTIGGQSGSGPKKVIEGTAGSRPTISGQAGSAPNRTNNTNNSSGDCFVATAAFGTPLAKEINILREYRDSVLRYSSSGRKFISFYYSKGPYLAGAIRKYPVLKKPVRFFIKGLITLMK